MKTTMKAALLLLSGTIFFSQASWAGKPAAPCAFNLSTSTSCMSADGTKSLIEVAFENLEAAEGSFLASRNGQKNFDNLTCKLSLSEVKMGEDKAEDAFYKLSDSALKIETLRNQGKLDISDDMYDVLKSSIDAAASCAYDEAFE